MKSMKFFYGNVTFLRVPDAIKSTDTVSAIRNVTKIFQNFVNFTNLVFCHNQSEMHKKDDVEQGHV